VASTTTYLLQSTSITHLCRRLWSPSFLGVHKRGGGLRLWPQSAGRQIDTSPLPISKYFFLHCAWGGTGRGIQLNSKSGGPFQVRRSISSQAVFFCIYAINNTMILSINAACRDENVQPVQGQLGMGSIKKQTQKGAEGG